MTVKTHPANVISVGRPVKFWDAAAQPHCGLLERMPKWLICVPLTVQWLWLALRYGSTTLPSAANPAITSGGLVGEGKLEYFSAWGR